MAKLIKCHFYYLFNKTNVTIIFLLILFVFIFSITNAFSLDESISYNQRSLEYYNNSFQLIKVIMSFDAIFIFGYSFLAFNDSYRIIVINNEIKREKYFISKTITLIITIIIMYLIQVSIILLISVLFRIYFDMMMIISFIDLLVYVTFYSFITLFVINVINSIYIIFLVYILTLLSYQEEYILLKYLLPLFKDNILVLNRFYYILLIIIVYILCMFLWNNKDL